MFECSSTTIDVASAEQWLSNDLFIEKHVDSSQISKISLRNNLVKIGRLIRPKRVIMLALNWQYAIRRKRGTKKTLDNKKFPENTETGSPFSLLSLA